MLLDRIFVYRIEPSRLSIPATFLVRIVQVVIVVRATRCIATISKLIVTSLKHGVHVILFLIIRWMIFAPSSNPRFVSAKLSDFVLVICTVFNADVFEPKFPSRSYCLKKNLKSPRAGSIQTTSCNYANWFGTSLSKTRMRIMKRCLMLAGVKIIPHLKTTHPAITSLSPYQQCHRFCS